MIDTGALLVMGVMVAAALVRSTLGFGDTLIVMSGTVNLTSAKWPLGEGDACSCHGRGHAAKRRAPATSAQVAKA